jgi:hypothetical protein
LKSLLGGNRTLKLQIRGNLAGLMLSWAAAGGSAVSGFRESGKDAAEAEAPPAARAVAADVAPDLGAGVFLWYVTVTDRVELSACAECSCGTPSLQN